MQRIWSEVDLSPVELSTGDRRLPRCHGTQRIRQNDSPPPAGRALDADEGHRSLAPKFLRFDAPGVSPLCRCPLARRRAVWRTDRMGKFAPVGRPERGKGLGGGGVGGQVRIETVPSPTGKRVLVWDAPAPPPCCCSCRLAQSSVVGRAVRIFGRVRTLVPSAGHFRAAK